MSKYVFKIQSYHIYMDSLAYNYHISREISIINPFSLLFPPLAHYLPHKHTNFVRKTLGLPLVFYSAIGVLLSQSEPNCVKFGTTQLHIFACPSAYCYLTRQLCFSTFFFIKHKTNISIISMQ